MAEKTCKTWTKAENIQLQIAPKEIVYPKERSATKETKKLVTDVQMDLMHSATKELSDRYFESFGMPEERMRHMNSVPTAKWLNGK